MSRRNIKKIGRQVITSRPVFRMKKKSQQERDSDGYNKYIAYIDNEERVDELIINSLKKHTDRLKATSELSRNI